MTQRPSLLRKLWPTLKCTWANRHGRFEHGRTIWPQKVKRPGGSVVCRSSMLKYQMDFKHVMSINVYCKHTMNNELLVPLRDLHHERSPPFNIRGRYDHQSTGVNIPINRCWSLLRHAHKPLVDNDQPLHLVNQLLIGLPVQGFLQRWSAKQEPWKPTSKSIMPEAANNSNANGSWWFTFNFFQIYGCFAILDLSLEIWSTITSRPHPTISHLRLSFDLWFTFNTCDLWRRWALWIGRPASIKLGKHKVVMCGDMTHMIACIAW